MVTLKETGNKEKGLFWEIISEKPLFCWNCKEEIKYGELVYICTYCHKTFHTTCFKKKDCFRFHHNKDNQQINYLGTLKKD